MFIYTYIRLCLYVCMYCSLYSRTKTNGLIFAPPYPHEIPLLAETTFRPTPESEKTGKGPSDA